MQQSVSVQPEPLQPEEGSVLDTLSDAPKGIQDAYQRASARSSGGEHPAVKDSINIAYYLAHRRLDTARSRFDRVDPTNPPELTASFRKARELAIRVDTAFTRMTAPVFAPQEDTYESLGIKFLTPIRSGIAQLSLPIR